MTDSPITFADGRAVLLCPQCGFEYTHLDEVFMLGRSAEDGDLVPVHVTNTGEIGSGPYPVGYSGIGRRHEITLAGHCENGHQFRVTFKQHKGETYVEATILRTTPTGHEIWVPAKELT